MIRRTTKGDIPAILEIINDAAQAYHHVIPDDRWHDPYMSMEELTSEIEAKVVFWGFEEAGRLIGVMGVQVVEDVTLIRHAYVRSSYRKQGIGGQLLTFLQRQTTGPILMGTWAAASWAVAFYQKYGFRLVSVAEKNRLLKKYWTIPERQIETSVVLTNQPDAEK